MYILVKGKDFTRRVQVFQAIFVGFCIDLSIKFYCIRMELPFLDKVCCCIRFQQVSMTNTFSLKATAKITRIVLHDKHEASHDKEKSYTLQTHINTDLEDHRTLLHRTKLTYIHTHTFIRSTFCKAFDQNHNQAEEQILM